MKLLDILVRLVWGRSARPFADTVLDPTAIPPRWSGHDSRAEQPAFSPGLLVTTRGR
jgi:hypothetical protein